MCPSWVQLIMEMFTFPKVIFKWTMRTLDCKLNRHFKLLISQMLKLILNGEPSQLKKKSRKRKIGLGSSSKKKKLKKECLSKN